MKWEKEDKFSLPKCELILKHMSDNLRKSKLVRCYCVELRDILFMSTASKIADSSLLPYQSLSLMSFITQVSAGSLPQLGTHQGAVRDPRPFLYPSQREIFLYLLPFFFAVIIPYCYLLLLYKYVYSNVILIYDFKKFVNCKVKSNLTVKSECVSLLIFNIGCNWRYEGIRTWVDPRTDLETLEKL